MWKKLINIIVKKVGLSNFPHQLCMSCFPWSDYKEGFGGKFGVQKDRQDKSAVGWDHLEAKQQHDSQKGLFLISYFSFWLPVLSCLVALPRL